MGDFEESGNFASLVLRWGERRPDRLALEIPRAGAVAAPQRAERWTFGELARRVARLERGFERQGIGSGDRVVLLFPLCADLYAALLAVMARGATVVFIDTGMGARKIRWALDDAAPRAVVAGRDLLRYRWLLPALWRPKKFSVDGGGLGLASFDELLGPDGGGPRIARGDPHRCALLTFTSGSTGRPKGAERTHDILAAQHAALLAKEPVRADDVAMSCFPVAVLHFLACGVPSILPAVDFARVAAVAPRPVVDQAERAGVSFLSGAPAFMRRLADHMVAEGRRLPRIRSVAVGGAPVPRELCRDLEALFPGSSNQIVYGSTEAEPLSAIAMGEALELEGEGFVVGAPVPQVALELVALPPGVSTVDEMSAHRVARGAVGEVVAAGRHVVRRYFRNPTATAATKIRDRSGTVWHRTGDLAWQDEADRLWLVGRTRDAIPRPTGMLHPLPVEAALDALPEVRRAALVAHKGAPRGEVIIEPATDAWRPAARALLARLGLDDLPLSAIDRIPLDGRHNSKIDRPALRRLHRRRW